MSNNLKRTLNLKDAISIVAGSMIGSGIFIVSAEISRQTNSVILLLLCWILAGVTTLCGALCYGELSSTIPDEGGQYVFLKKIYNEKLAFIYGLKPTNKPNPMINNIETFKPELWQR